MSTSVELIPILSTNTYRLAYALPLFFVSLLLAFAGTSFTLDRSRSFPPSTGGGKDYSSVPGSFTNEKLKLRKWNWILEGGIGGLAGGYAFGIHFSTALSLLIPATTNSATLSSKTFLAVWILSCIITTSLAGRYRYAALLFFGISGGTLTALALCIITHPSLPARVILIAIFLPLFTAALLLTAILPIPLLTTTFLHPILRFCTASIGAFGVTFAIAILLKPAEEGWGNVWERLWLRNSDPGSTPWGTGREQGLSAGYSILLVIGVITDWALRRWIGECPDEKWDNYLSQYAANLPNQPNRAGTFQPFSSFLERFFAFAKPTAPYSKEILFSNEADIKSKLSLPLPVTMKNVPTKKAERDSMKLDQVPSSVELLKKKSRRRPGWTTAADRRDRKPVKFGELSDSDSDDDESDDETKKATDSSQPPSSPVVGGRHAKRPWTLTNTQNLTSTSSTPTLVGLAKNIHPDSRLDVLETLDYDQEIAQIKEQRRERYGDIEMKDDLEYSDYEEDLASKRFLGAKKDNDYSGVHAGWSPAFLKQKNPEQQQQSSPGPAIPVPATPSLIKALDRLALAQREAFGLVAATVTAGVNDLKPQPGTPYQTFDQSPTYPIAASHTALTPTKKTREQISTSAPTRPAGSSRGQSKPRIATPEDAEAGTGNNVKPIRKGGLDKTKTTGIPRDQEKERSPRWEEFWREVKVKAQS